MSHLIKNESPSKRYARLQPWLSLANMTTQALRRSGWWALLEQQRMSGAASEDRHLKQRRATEGRGQPWRESQVQDPLLDQLYRTAEALWPQVLQSQTRALGAVRSFLVCAQDTSDFPAAAIRDWFGIGQDDPPKDQARQEWRLLQLGIAVSDVFRYCADTRKSRTDLFHGIGPGTAVVFDGTGTRLAVEIFDPWGKFLSAIKGAEIDRIRRCPICQNFFFALRTAGVGGYDASSKACSNRCNQVRRTRELRDREARQTERVWILHQEGKDGIAIARELDIKPKEARAYLARAKKEHRE